MYNMVSLVGNTAFLFLLLVSFLFQLWLAIHDRPYDRSFLSFYTIRDNALTHNPGWPRMACSEPVKCRRVNLD